MASLFFRFKCIILILLTLIERGRNQNADIDQCNNLHMCISNYGGKAILHNSISECDVFLVIE